MILYPSSTLPQYGPSTVTIEGLLLGVALDGVEWHFDALDGWTLGGGVSTTIADRPGAHGSFDGPSYRRSRVINISGTCIADTPLLANDAAERLAAVLADGGLGTITVDSPGRALSASVRLSDTPQAQWLSRNAFRWALQLTAPDSRKYALPGILTADLATGDEGQGLTFPLAFPLLFDDGAPAGRVSFSNNGTAPSEPVFTVAGSFPSGFQVTHVETGARLRYEAPAVGEYLLDAREGRVSIDGQDRSGYLTVREWPSVPPRSSATFAISAIGDPALASGSLTVTFSPAFH